MDHIIRPHKNTVYVRLDTKLWQTHLHSKSHMLQLVTKHKRPDISIDSGKQPANQAVVGVKNENDEELWKTLNCKPHDLDYKDRLRCKSLLTKRRKKMNHGKFWETRLCVGLLNEKPGCESQVRHQNKLQKSISSAISSQQISGKNSESKLKLPWKVSQKICCSESIFNCKPRHLSIKLTHTT